MVQVVNIFVTSPDPALSAQALDNKRVGKMLIEAVQMLSTAALTRDSSLRNVEGLYRPTHPNHPCTLWAGESRSNWLWLHEHASALAREYSYRYGREHATGQKLAFVLRCAWTIPNGDLTPFANCAAHRGLGLDRTSLPPVEAYRSYLNHRWDTDKRAPEWGSRGAPEWRT